MKLIGLTGGIGSGKSTVAALLAEAGLVIVDADRLAREIVEPGQPALEALVEAFGPDILDADGKLRRATLAARAFASEEATARLNAITHPAVRALAQQRFDEAAAAGEACAVYDMPLLIELGLDADMDLTIAITADADRRVRRLVTKRGLEEDDVRRRMRAQLSDEERIAHADIVIANDGDEAALRREVHGALERIRALL